MLDILQATTTTATTTADMLANNTTLATFKATATTTITSDPGILCFHHCNVKVFCFALPHTCPHCNAQLDADAADNEVVPPAAATTTTTMVVLPFRLPYPFVRATQHPCAIVLRPSIGDFLNDYSNATDLHIAVTTSAGDIVEFDRYGLQRHRREQNPAEWWQTLLVGDVPEPWHDYWDEVLQQICAQTLRWSIARYEEATHNCYTFVLAFLQALGHDQLSQAAHSKTSFCEQYIVPRTTTAGKYISLYRKLRAAGIYVHRQQPKQQRSAKQRVADDENAAERQPAGGKLAAKQATLDNAYASNGISMSRALRHSRQTLCTIEE